MNGDARSSALEFTSMPAASARCEPPQDPPVLRDQRRTFRNRSDRFGLRAFYEFTCGRGVTIQTVLRSDWNPRVSCEGQ